MSVNSDALTERFEDKYCPEPNTGCWLWTAHINNCGYGKFLLNGKPANAHRVSYELYVGPIPEGMHVLHSCDTPACVCPQHLSIGTHQENMADMMRKGRQTKNTGSKNPRAKLTEDQAMAIFNDTRHEQEISADYGITRGQVLRIKTKHRWQHIHPPQESNDG